jgi:epoxide hydrolase-like predicted phosphatase
MAGILPAAAASWRASLPRSAAPPQLTHPLRPSSLTIGSVAGPSQTVRGVILDWGGVFTNPIADSVDAWLEHDQIDRESYVAVMRPWVRQAYGPGNAESPVHALERGEVPDAEFEEILAGLLVRVGGGPVQASGLLRRMWAASVLDDDMLDLVRGLRRDGLRTCLLSNSWGAKDGYPRHLFGELFDQVVISGEVGMRKPEERIFALATERIGLPAHECVFVDDIEGNILAARALGFAAVHHRDPELTRAELAQLIGTRRNGEWLPGASADPAQAQ